MTMVSLQITAVILALPMIIYALFGLHRVADAFYVNVYMNGHMATLAAFAVIWVAFAVVYGIVRAVLWDLQRSIR